jgi:hypothetical protein
MLSLALRKNCLHHVKHHATLSERPRRKTRPETIDTATTSKVTVYDPVETLGEC